MSKITQYIYLNYSKNCVNMVICVYLYGETNCSRLPEDP